MQRFSQMLFHGLKGYVRIVAMDVNKKVLWARHYPPRRFLELLQNYEPTPDIQLYILPVTRSRYSAKKEAACQAQVLWIDIDHAEADLSDCSIKPNIHVSSGGGHHYYWLLEKPISLHEPSSQTKFEQALKAIQGKYHGDPAVTHVSANMRMPGSFNLKYKALDGNGVGVKTTWDMIHDEPVSIATVAALAKSYAPAIPKPEPYKHKVTAKTSYVKTSGHTGKKPFMVFADVIENECGAVQSALSCPSLVKEPEWFALLRLCAALPTGGESLATNLSAGHPDYSSQSLSAKLSHAARYKPPTCSTLSMLNGCGGCKWAGDVKSPLGIPAKIRNQ